MKVGLVRIGIAPIILLIIFISIALFTISVQAQSTQIISRNIGDTITFQGTPGTTVTISSTTRATMSGNYYSLEINDITLPACTITISVHPVNTITVDGSQNILGIWVPASRTFTPSGSTGSYSYETGGASYKVRVSGIATSADSQVMVDVFVSQEVRADNTEVRFSTVNLPAGVYYLNVDGTVVEEIYLGVEAPLTYTLSLHKGWNLFSLPIVPRDNRISSIFTDDQLNNINVIWDYNGGNWLYNTKRPGYTSQFSTFSVSKGYYAYCKVPISVQIIGSAGSGAIPYDSLSKGWNLIGYPTMDSSNTESVYPLAYVLWKIDSGNGNWYYFTHRPGYTSQFTTLSPGHGYWVNKK